MMVMSEDDMDHVRLLKLESTIFLTAANQGILLKTFPHSKLNIRLLGTSRTWIKTRLGGIAELPFGSHPIA